MRNAPLLKGGPIGARRRAQRGFTLMEALVAVVLLGIGIAASVASFGTLANSEANARQTENMFRLAQEKLAELTATGQITTASSGDFSDQNEPDFNWSSDVNTSDVTDLSSVTISVTAANSQRPAVKLQTMVYVPPQTTTTGSTGTTTGGTTA